MLVYENMAVEYPSWTHINLGYINGLVQDYNNSIANTLELLQSCTKLLLYKYLQPHEMIRYNQSAI